MAEVINTNANRDGTEWNTRAGVIHSFIGPRDVKCFKILVINGSSEAVDISSETGDNANGPLAVHHILQAVEIKSTVLAYQVENDTTGQISLMLEGRAWTASDMQTAIQALGTTVGGNNVDVSASTVADAGFKLA